MKTRKTSISTQLFLFILGAFLIVALIVGGVSYSIMGRFLRQKTMDNVMEIAVIAAENVDAEIVYVSELLLSMNTDMKNIEDSIEETFQNISGMNRELSGYRIDGNR